VLPSPVTGSRGKSRRRGPESTCSLRYAVQPARPTCRWECENFRRTPGTATRGSRTALGAARGRFTGAGAGSPGVRLEQAEFRETFGVPVWNAAHATISFTSVRVAEAPGRKELLPRRVRGTSRRVRVSGYALTAVRGDAKQVEAGKPVRDRVWVSEAGRARHAGGSGQYGSIRWHCRDTPGPERTCLFCGRF
jgi:hypothetical protein